MPGAPSATDSGRRTAGSVFPNSARRQQATLDERAVPGCRIADFLFEELAEDEDLPGVRWVLR